MAIKNQIIHDGKVFYSVKATAKLLGTTTTKIKQIMIPDGLEWTNFRVNGAIWISASSVNAYIDRQSKSGTHK